MTLVLQIALGIILAPILFWIILLIWRPIWMFLWRFYLMYIVGFLGILVLGLVLKYSEKLYLAMGFDDFGFPFVIVGEMVFFLIAGAILYEYRKEIFAWFIKKFMPEKFSKMNQAKAETKPWSYPASEKYEKRTSIY